MKYDLGSKDLVFNKITFLDIENLNEYWRENQVLVDRWLIYDWQMTDGSLFDGW